MQNLRTVIVTAAVHRGFSSHREALTLTFRHWAGVSPYTSTFVLAETCVFDKQFRGLFSCGLHTKCVSSSQFPLLNPNLSLRSRVNCGFILTLSCFAEITATTLGVEADLIPKLRSLYCRVP